VKEPHSAPVFFVVDLTIYLKHRPLVRLSSRKQRSVRDMQQEMRSKEKELLSNPASTYRLPGFNHHVVRNKNESVKTNTSFQTPQEQESIKLTKTLNKLSTSSVQRISLPVAKNKKFQFSSESSKEASLLMSTSSSVHTEEVESYVSELRKQVDPSLSPSPDAVANKDDTPLVESLAKSLDADGLFYLEAEGSNEVWIPSGRMPSKRERFATYPAVRNVHCTLLLVISVFVILILFVYCVCDICLTAYLWLLHSMLNYFIVEHETRWPAPCCGWKS
jgi:hypothetical protein